jgi:hypothetical protein
MNPLDIAKRIEAKIKITDEEFIFLAINYQSLDRQVQNLIKQNEQCDLVIQYLIGKFNSASELVDELRKQLAARDKRIDELEQSEQAARKKAAEEERWSETFRDQNEAIWGIWRDAGRGWRVNY